VTVLHIGLIINPLAGLGGSIALKGSDGPAVRAMAAEFHEGTCSRAMSRAARALALLQPQSDNYRFSTAPGLMGEASLRACGFPAHVLGVARESLSSSQDTRQAALALAEAGVDVLLFAGGDGTARDIFDAVGDRTPVLGIPAGVKMHSGVFAVSPEAAGELLHKLADGALVGLAHREVRDIDEEAFRHDVVKSRFYGEMLVPGDGSYLQHTKVGGRESQELVAAEIAAWWVETLCDQTTYFIGPGSTTAAIMEALGLPNTLLGVDVIRGGQLLASDADESVLLEQLAQAPAAAHIVVTAIGGQGHILGRGNQQFTPQVLRRVGVNNLTVVAAKSKIASLQGRPLLVDSNDAVLDAQFSGYRTVITGYDDRILYPVSTGV
jgi:predicted polyphosphate/ATP-dependent NAD kinase